jgi:hypothetical protein
MLIEMRLTNIAVPFEMLGTPDHALGPMEQAERCDLFGEGLSVCVPVRSTSPSVARLDMW